MSVEATLNSPSGVATSSLSRSIEILFGLIAPIVLDAAALVGAIAILEESDLLLLADAVIVVLGIFTTTAAVVALTILDARKHREAWPVAPDLSALFKLMRWTMPASVAIAIILIGLVPPPHTEARVLSVILLIVLLAPLVYFAPAFAYRETKKNRGCRRRMFRVPFSHFMNRLHSLVLSGTVSKGKVTRNPIMRYVETAEFTTLGGGLRVIRMGFHRTVVELQPSAGWRDRASLIERLALEPRTS